MLVRKISLLWNKEEVTLRGLSQSFFTLVYCRFIFRCDLGFFFSLYVNTYYFHLWTFGASRCRRQIYNIYKQFNRSSWFLPWYWCRCRFTQGVGQHLHDNYVYNNIPMLIIGSVEHHGAQVILLSNILKLSTNVFFSKNKILWRFFFGIF
jgi:hypothetical protein